MCGAASERLKEKKRLNGRTWTEDENRRLKFLAGEGISAQSIAKSLRRSIPSIVIVQKARELKLSLALRPKAKNEPEVIPGPPRTEYLGPKSIRELRLHFGCSVTGRRLEVSLRGARRERYAKYLVAQDVGKPSRRLLRYQSQNCSRHLSTDQPIDCLRSTHEQ
jgi:hypothetical protein